MDLETTINSFVERRRRLYRPPSGSATAYEGAGGRPPLRVWIALPASCTPRRTDVPAHERTHEASAATARNDVVNEAARLLHRLHALDGDGAECAHCRAHAQALYSAGLLAARVPRDQNRLTAMDGVLSDVAI